MEKVRNALPWVRKGLPVLALAMLGWAAYLDLSWAPPTWDMGNVYRIIFIHVPCMWMALLLLTVNFVCAVVYLLKPSWGADALAESTAEVGLAFGSVGVVLGSIWGRPTWGVYWSWDPRLTTFAIMMVAYAGYMALRKFIEDPERRAVWSAVVAIISAVDVPIVYFSVRWWRSLHQVQSSPKTVDPAMVHALHVSSYAVLFLMLWFLWTRYRLARVTLAREVALPPELPPTAAPAGA
jgi:heme exporter protein C